MAPAPDGHGWRGRLSRAPPSVFTGDVLIWALISHSCRETVELYLDPVAAAADLRAALADVPEWADDLEVIPLRWLVEPEVASLN